MRWVIGLVAMTVAAVAAEPTSNELSAAETACLISGSEALPKSPGLHVSAARGSRVGPDVSPPKPDTLVFWLEYDVEAVGRRITYTATCFYEWSKPPTVVGMDIRVPR
jgi:hypothetical protein